MSSHNRPQSASGSSPINDPSAGSVIEWHSVHRKGESNDERGQCQVTPTMNTLSDDALLEVFYHFRGEGTYYFQLIWIPLLHVCKRWRRIIFASPRRLHLLLHCQNGRRPKKSLDIWPTLPFVLHYNSWDMDVYQDVIAAFKHHDRMAGITFDKVPSSMFEKISAFMQEPLPALTRLTLNGEYVLGGKNTLVLPKTFLGGSTPRPEHCSLYDFIFPALPTLLISARYLASLDLSSMPISGFFSPEVMANCLSTLPNLKWLRLEFEYPRGVMTRPDLTSPSQAPLTPADLPSLFAFYFGGHSEYLEDLLARIDATSLHHLAVHLFLNPVAYMSNLYRLIAHNERLKGFHLATVNLNPWSVFMAGKTPSFLDLTSYSGTLGSQTSFITQVLENHVDRVESLSIYGGSNYGVISEGVDPQGDMETQQWLDLFRLFTAAEELVVAENLVPAVARVLRGLTEGMAAEVLPALRRLILGKSDWIGSLREAIEPFPTTRELAGRPVSLW